MFLLVYHVPVLCALTLLIDGCCASAASGRRCRCSRCCRCAALLFAGPFCELAVGLVVGPGAAPGGLVGRLAAPLFFVFMLVCTKAWVDGLLGRPYTWAKTARSGRVDGAVAPLHGGGVDDRATVATGRPRLAGRLRC